jgi:UPF0176 protein
MSMSVRMNMNQLPIVNLSGYRFVTIKETQLTELRANLKNKALECQLKGTILLSVEGINAFLAGTREQVDQFVSYLRTMSEFADIWFKESFSEYQPFNRMLVRIKKEIIPIRKDSIVPEKKTAPYVSPEELKQWYAEKRDMIVLDTRNEYEVQLGTFENAMDLHLAHFNEFDEAVDFLPQELKEKTIVTFCTGGIRCEKAAELMAQKGFKNVYQLNGGILNYFEKCGGDFYNGECFVFDQRVALNSALQETDTKQCFDCRTPLKTSEVCDAHCPQCGSKAISKSMISNLESGVSA